MPDTPTKHLQQPWIGQPVTDIIFILFPPFGALLFIALFPGMFQDTKGIPVAAWVILILLIDVAHVYSTLYRTYFDKKAFQKQKALLIGIPFIGFVIGVFLYWMGDLIFWRILAYVAIFHFVRQQYGFMRVYSRKENVGRWMKFTDSLMIYAAAIYPVLYWHLSGPKNFNWFLEQDLLYFESPALLSIFSLLYYCILLFWIGKEVWLIIRYRSYNLPRILVITGTILSWYFGIVYFNGDMAFTLLNVVSHGIPYMAMVWLYGKKNYTSPGKGTRFLKLLFSRYGLFIFLSLLFLLAFIEEGIWDIAVWKEHTNIFGNGWSGIVIPDEALMLLVPLLALPQITHYILDGFIWKISKDEFKWNNEIGKPIKSPVQNVL
jgi:hypothetical protein